MAITGFSIGDLSVPLPIIQGGMGIGVSLSGLASAVAEQGGVGVIATAGIGWDEPDFKNNYVEANSRALARHIRTVREKTSGVLGVNIMVALTNYDEMVQTALDHGVDIIFSGAGLPLSLPKHMQGRTSPKLVPIISSARAAEVISKKWMARYDRVPDAFVVEGPMAGGHLGFKPEQIHDKDYALERLIPEVLETVAAISDAAGVRIPVIAAGGIYTGADIHKYLEMGAAAVQMGTRFVATHECDAADGFKQAYLDAREEDISIIKSPVGLPGRAIRNKFIEAVESGQKKPYACPVHCIRSCDYTKSPYCITVALLNARRGSMEVGLAFAGQNAYRVESIVSVKELMDTLLREYEEHVRSLAKPEPATVAETPAGPVAVQAG